MNKSKAKLLDKLLTELIKKENKNRLGWVNSKKLNIKNLNESELINLLYLIRKEQNKLPDKLISGSNTSLRPNELHIDDFLFTGGFEYIYKQRRKKFLIEFFKVLITVLTFIILIYATFFKNNDSKEPLLKEKKMDSIKSKKIEAIKNLNHKK